MTNHTDTRNETVAVLGAGAWGTTAADMIARSGATVRLWDLHPDKLKEIERDRRPFGVPELDLDTSVVLESDLAAALHNADFAILVIPSQAIATLAANINQTIATTQGTRPVPVLLSKGIDLKTLRPLSDVVAHHYPGVPVGVVSGPCIAREVARRMPTSVVAACADPDIAARIRDLFTSPWLRVYTQHDVLGVELGGALKNVIAIAAGIGDGLGFGENSKSALLTRGLAEMVRLAHALGADPNTLWGLAGLGDLCVTCFSPHSRNRTFGEHLGRGLTAEQARAEIGMTVEGEPTARAALQLGEKHNIPLPVTQAVVHVCTGQWTPNQAVEQLMQRELKDEF